MRPLTKLLRDAQRSLENSRELQSEVARGREQRLLARLESELARVKKKLEKAMDKGGETSR